jgi:hypothetical protein
MAAPNFKEAVDQANQLLARSGTSWRLEVRGRRLGLRGPLPPREGTGQEPLATQRLSLGLEACEASLPRAFASLHAVREQLSQGTFRWVDWQRSRAGLSPVPSRPIAGPPSPLASPTPAPVAQPPELEEAVASFERAFHQDPRRRRFPAGARSTWRAAYKPYLRRLLALGAQRRASLSPELLVAVLESYPLASRSRQQCALVLGALARQREMPLPADWQELGRGYGLHAARFRPLPSDAQILRVVEQIPNPRWRLVYGLMATYGLRNHEVFFCDVSALAPGGDRVLRVLPTSKTGEHQVWPFQPEWVEIFALERLGRDPEGLPAVDTDLRRTSLQRVGQRVSPPMTCATLGPCAPFTSVCPTRWRRG